MLLGRLDFHLTRIVAHDDGRAGFLALHTTADAQAGPEGNLEQRVDRRDRQLKLGVFRNWIQDLHRPRIRCPQFDLSLGSRGIGPRGVNGAKTNVFVSPIRNGFVVLGPNPAHRGAPFDNQGKSCVILIDPCGRVDEGFDLHAMPIDREHLIEPPFDIFRRRRIGVGQHRHLDAACLQADRGDDCPIEPNALAWLERRRSTGKREVTGFALRVVPEIFPCRIHKVDADLHVEIVRLLPRGTCDGPEILRMRNLNRVGGGHGRPSQRAQGNTTKKNQEEDSQLEPPHEHGFTLADRGEKSRFFRAWKIKNSVRTRTRASERARPSVLLGEPPRCARQRGLVDCRNGGTRTQPADESQRDHSC